MSKGFISNTSVASSNIGSNIASHFRPVEVSRNKFECFVRAEVFCCRCIMILTHNVKLELPIVRDKDKTIKKVQVSTRVKGIML